MKINRMRTENVVLIKTRVVSGYRLEKYNIRNFFQVIVLNSTDGYMVGETKTLLRNLAKETNNGTETATLSVSIYIPLMSVGIAL